MKKNEMRKEGKREGRRKERVREIRCTSPLLRKKERGGVIFLAMKIVRCLNNSLWVCSRTDI